MVSITISAANGKAPPFARKALPLTIDVSQEDTIEDVKAKVAAKIPKFYASRQKITLATDKKALADETKLLDLSLGEGGQLAVKDLGPQVSWRTVFLIEYAGPLVIHPLIYHLPELFYGKTVVHSKLQKLVYVLIILHYLKRELETIFVHRFSHGTMPASNIIKNSGHYHIFSGLFLAYDLYRPTFSANSAYIKGTLRNNETFLLACTGLWAFFELSNLYTHLTLRNLRPAGTKKRSIPYGYGFSLVSCPNYFFETLAWVVICVMTGSWACVLFISVGLFQMALWALKKHAAYKKDFGKEYPRGRKAIIPFIL